MILILILSYFAYTKSLPWADEGYTATATFAERHDAARDEPRADRRRQRRQGDRGRAADGEGAKVTFSVDEDGLPLHEDARITIRPRLFLEGNFFLDLRPGSPSAPDIPDGGDIPVTQTATAVQLDEVLTALQAPDRENLARLLNGYGSALADKPDRRAGHRPGPRRPGRVRPRRRSTTPSTTAARPARPPRRSRRPCSARRPAICAA